MGQTIQDFTRIYDTYIAGVKSGELRKISTLLSQELRSGIKTKEDQQEFMRMAKYMVPESYEPLFLTMIEGGRKAELQAETSAHPTHGVDPGFRPAGRQVEMGMADYFRRSR